MKQARSPRRAIVTGGGSGIGRQLCLQLAEAGWTVAVVDIDHAAADETAELLQNATNGSLAYSGDVSQALTWESLLSDLRNRWQRIDLLVNNAGVLAGGAVQDVAPEVTRRVIDVNLTATLVGCQMVMPWLIASAERAKPSNVPSPQSGIINTASIFATLSPPGFAAYNASKAGVVALSESLRAELSPHGLNVTVTLPGIVQTGLFTRASFATPAFGSAARKFVERTDLAPKKVAAETLLAAHRGNARVVIGARARRLDWLRRWLPGISRAAIDRQARTELGLGKPEMSGSGTSGIEKPSET